MRTHWRPPPSSTAEPTKLRVEMVGIPAPLIALFSTDETKFQSPEKLLQGLRLLEGNGRESVRIDGLIERSALNRYWLSRLSPTCWKTALDEELDETHWGFDHPVITMPCQDKYAVSKF